MNTELDFCVIDKDGTNLFYIDYVPPIGSTLSFTVEWSAIEKDNFSWDTLNLWKQNDRKTFKVIAVHGDVRNYGDKVRVVRIVEVEEIIGREREKP